MNNVPICRDYDDVREQKLDSPIYPASIRALAAASHSDDVLRKAQNTAIPEFMRFNIVENEVRDVV